jgi:hypothetical protein
MTEDTLRQVVLVCRQSHVRLSSDRFDLIHPCLSRGRNMGSKFSFGTTPKEESPPTAFCTQPTGSKAH